MGLASFGAQYPQHFVNSDSFDTNIPTQTFNHLFWNGSSYVSTVDGATYVKIDGSGEYIAEPVTIPSLGYYAVGAVVQTQGSSADSVRVRFDAGGTHSDWVIGPPHGVWKYVEFVTQWQLSAASHSLRFEYLEPIEIDAAVVIKK